MIKETSLLQQLPFDAHYHDCIVSLVTTVGVADLMQVAIIISRQTVFANIISNQQSAMQMNGCSHLVPLYPYHATNYQY